MRVLVLITIIFFSISFSNCEPTVTVTPSRNDVEVLEDVTLKCSVKDGGSNTVVWEKTDSHMIISENDKLRVDSDKFSINVKKSATENSADYILTIYAIAFPEHGVYTCKVKETSKSAIVNVKAKTEPPKTPPGDFRKCCREKNVAEKCQPACKPSTRGANFNVSDCQDDVNTLIHCGSDGRNHIRCCVRRNIDPSCFDVCAPSKGKIFGNEYLHCLLYLDPITQCFEEGQTTLPSRPYNLIVLKRSETTLQIVWRPSTSKIDKRLKYHVHYRAASEKTHYTDEPVDGTSYLIKNLKPNEKYYIYVVAWGIHGHSLPSDEISEYTKGYTTFKDEVQMKQCCIDAGITGDCVTELCTVQGQRNTQGVTNCYKYKKQFFQCLSNNGNHTSCCKRRGVPETCRPICDSTVDLDATESLLTGCNGWMPDVLSCADESMIKFPPIPTSIIVEDVSTTEATIKWNNVTGINKYLVTYYKSGSVQRMTKVSDSSPLTLNQLNPNTLYHATVQSVNGTIYSLKSTDVSFLTYSDDGLVNPNPPNPSPPYDIKKCCKKLKVADKCMELCHYNLDVSKLSFDHLDCIINKNLSSIISCGNSGRDHTRCCELRQVSRKCISKCKYNIKKDGTVNWLHSDNNCLSDLPSMVSCMQDGVKNIPTAPTEFVILDKTTHSLTLQWSYPEFLADKVKHYAVHSIIDGKSNFFSVPKNVTNYIIQNLKPNTVYKVYVISVGETGSSLPSTVIDARTLPNENSTIIRVNVTDCCKKKKVKSECLDACDGSVPLNLNQCGTSVSKILQCAADNKNHGECCKKNKVSEKCLRLCDGTKQANFSSFLHALECHQNMDRYFSCFVGSIAPTEQFILQDETNQSLTFSWKVEKGITYDIFYSIAIGGKDWINLENVTSPYTIKSLEADTIYKVYLRAKNANGAYIDTDINEVRTSEDNTIPIIVITTKPKVDKPLKKGKVELKCDAIGHPKPKVSWTYRNETVENKETYKFNLDDKSQGEYTCWANSPKGVSSSVYVKFLQKPKLMDDKPSYKTNTLSNNFVTAYITCSFNGWPDEVSWMKNGEQISFNKLGFYHLSTENFIDKNRNLYVSVLNFHPILPGDNAEYTCTGKNSLGSDKGVLNLSVIEGEKGQIKTFEDCCKKSSIEEKCKTYCGKSEIKDSHCRAEITSLSTCIDIIKPIKVTDVKAHASESCFNISWTSDKKSLVQNYKIFLTKDRTLEFDTKSLKNSFCIASNLNGKTKYGISVQSVGVSHTSVLSDRIIGETPDKKPGSPNNLKSTIDGSMATVSWSPPKSYPYLVKKYRIELHIRDGKKDVKPITKTLDYSKTSHKFKIDLTKAYTFSIQSEGSLGLSGQRSSTAVNKPQPQKTKSKGDDGPNPAAIVIPILLVIIIICIAVGAVFWWRKRRNPFPYSNSMDEHRVAFENPGYGNIGTEGVVNIKPGSGDGYGE